MLDIPHVKIGLVIAISVMATGAFINAASNGTFGSKLQPIANFIKNGYGV